MLDYSDEEVEQGSVRRRTQSPSDVFGVNLSGFGVRSIEGENVDASTEHKSRSIFKGFRPRSPKLKMPNDNITRGNALFVNEFIPGKDGIPFYPKSSLQNFAVNLHDVKGKEVFFRKSTNNNFSLNREDNPDSFFKSMKLVVILAQIFAILPVSGVQGSSYKSLRFKWIHYKTAYWALSFLGTLFCFVCVTAQGLDRGALTQSASDIAYFACGVLSCLLMLNLGRNWRKLNKEFAEVEFKFQKYGYPKGMTFKFRIFTILVLLVALAEHMLGKSKNIERAAMCAQRKKDFFSIAETFFLYEYSQVFSMNAYNFGSAVLVLIAHFFTTVNWNIKDVFLCLISWSIVQRFQQVNNLMNEAHGMERPISFWKEVREDFNTLSVLTKRVDTYIQKLMFLSIGNNLFFICIQLLHSLKRRVASVRIVYFFWSFGFLVVRTSFVAFSAARINDESKEPKTVLYSVPQKNYSAEVRRFLTQLTTNEVALTGSGFFAVTRSLILTITGTVITYEIVLVQFSGNEVDDELINNSTICAN